MEARVGAGRRAPHIKSLFTGQLHPHRSTVLSSLGPFRVGSNSGIPTAHPGGHGAFAGAQTATEVHNNDAQSWGEGSVMFNHDFKKMWTISLRIMKTYLVLFQKDLWASS